MALTDIVYKRKKEGKIAALVISSPSQKSWKTEQVIRYELDYYKLSSAETLSSSFKYPYRYTLMPIQHEDDIDLIKSEVLVYTPETIAEAADKYKALRMKITATCLGLPVSFMPESWRKAYKNINPFYDPARATGLTGYMQLGLSFIMYIPTVANMVFPALLPGAAMLMGSSNLPHYNMGIVLWLMVEGTIRTRVGFQLNRGCGSIIGVIIAIPFDVAIWIIKSLKKAQR